MYEQSGGSQAPSIEVAPQGIFIFSTEKPVRLEMYEGQLQFKKSSGETQMIDLSKVSKVISRKATGLVLFKGMAGQKTTRFMVNETGVGSMAKSRGLVLAIFALVALVILILTQVLILGGVLLAAGIIISDKVRSVQLDKARQVSSNWHVLESYLDGQVALQGKIKKRGLFF